MAILLVLVTWPLVMLLLDYWPLRRFELSILNYQLFCAWWGEKIPFFRLAAVVSVVTFMEQKREGFMAAGDNLPLGARSGNALMSHCRHLAGR